MSRRHGIDRALLALGGLVVVSSVARFALSRGVDAPWIAPDEQLYGLLGRSLVSGDGLSLLGEPVPYYSILYPLLVGVPFLWSELEMGVRWVQLLQAVVMSSTAIPVFLWARPLDGTSVGARWCWAHASHAGPRVQRSLHERGALLPRRDARRLGARGVPRAPDTRAPRLPAGRRCPRIRDEAAGSRPRRNHPARAGCSSPSPSVPWRPFDDSC